MKSSRIILALVIALTYSSSIFAQERNDTVQMDDIFTGHTTLQPYHRNVIKFNPTPMVLLGNVTNITFSYERLIRDDQSLAVQVGYLLFPGITEDTIAGLIHLTDRSKNGANLAFDYRWYPAARNRRPAPDGLYIGGYASYYGFSFRNDFNVLHVASDTNGSISGRLNFANLGFELGYQFIFWKRLSVDLFIFGPSLSMYYSNTSIEGKLTSDEIGDIEEEIVVKIKDRFPLFGTLFTDEAVKFNQSKASIDIGFRYSISIGYHF